ncbi:MAG TPA: electron transfer flavoprotein subunit beta/FixA family protein [Natronosporangium sp.]
MRVLVFVKHVPDASGERGFTPAGTVDRTLPCRLSELDEHAVEQALRLIEQAGTGEVTIATMGPPAAAETLRKALAMGGHAAVHVCDDRLAGTDALGTSLVLAEVARRVGFDLIVCGMASTDAGMSVVPAMLAERLGVPQLSFAAEVTVDLAGQRVRIRREDGRDTVIAEAGLPAVVSVTDQIGEARYPSFKGIMAARKLPLQTWDLAELGIPVDAVGMVHAAAVVESATPEPPRQPGRVVVDDGTAAATIAEFLRERRLLPSSGRN